MNLMQAYKFRKLLNADLQIQDYSLEQRLQAKSTILNGNYDTKEEEVPEAI